GGGGGGTFASSSGEVALRRSSSIFRLSSPRVIAQWWLAEKIGFIRKESRLSNGFSALIFPVVNCHDLIAFLLERPDAAPNEIAIRFEGVAFGIHFTHPKLPAQCVGQPAFGIQIDDPTNAVLVARFKLLHFKIHRGPPARQVGSVAKNIRDFLDGALYLPCGDEVVSVIGQGKSSFCG